MFGPSSSWVGGQTWDIESKRTGQWSHTKIRLFEVKFGVIALKIRPSKNIHNDHEHTRYLEKMSVLFSWCGPIRYFTLGIFPIGGRFRGGVITQILRRFFHLCSLYGTVWLPYPFRYPVTVTIINFCIFYHNLGLLYICGGVTPELN